jgi:hypothetical protein
MDKYDIKVAHKSLYSPSAQEFTLVEVPELQYIAVDGHGDPNTSADYAEAVESLYIVAYSLKFASKKTLARDFVVAPLEGLWRADDLTDFVTRKKSNWDWTMMIALPDWITPVMLATAVGAASSKKELAALHRLRLFNLDEGLAVQIMHHGSYDDEGPTLERLHKQYLPQNKLTPTGDHHEIYLSDPRRTASAKLKTILRQPVRS